MSRNSVALAALLLSPLAAAASEESVQGRWTADQAWAWHRAQPWRFGCNFLPSTAVNDVEMWQAATFDPATIDRELGWAQGLGVNGVRVFLNYVVWEQDAPGLRERFGAFLNLAAKRGIAVMPVLLDDCNFAGREAKAGPQPEPVPGVHNSQWVSSPPLKMVADPAAWPKVEAYVKDLIGAFGQDGRVAVWDLYNEPGNSGMGGKSLPLAEAAFRWAREAAPRQPLTVGAWTDFHAPMQRRMMELSDVVSFHGYDDAAGIRIKLEVCRGHGRPVVCTEWLRRQAGSTFEEILPLFIDAQVGAYHWGLVAGRTQTYLPWGSRPGTPEPVVWQHDVFRKDGTPFRADEQQLVRSLLDGMRGQPGARERFTVEGRAAFLIAPTNSPAAPAQPWVWYAPTLPKLPGPEEQWMFRKFLDAGIAIAGIDVGESYGSPQGRALFTALYEELTGRRGLSAKPCLLARSRGGLMLYNWAVEHPESVAGIAGIYPVCNIESYPGLARACGAYGMTAQQLAGALAQHNPVLRIAPLAKARVPILHIQGDADTVVPLEQNSAQLAQAYRQAGGDITVIVMPGRGHDMWPGWFQCQELVDFVIARGAGAPAAQGAKAAIQKTPPAAGGIAVLSTDSSGQ